MSQSADSDDLLQWALSRAGVGSGDGEPTLQLVAGDASNRCYYRLVTVGASYIVVHAPPETEKNREFLAVREVLEQVGLCVPQLFSADLEHGYLLLGDLGDRQLLTELDAENADACYQQVFDTLQILAGLEAPDPRWPSYDRELLTEELSRFPHWFVQELLGIAIDEDAGESLDGLFSLLIANSLEQPQVLVHRDFHSRNLMPQSDGRIGVIDFQDAVTGPVTYDLVSLLRDCYICWPPAQVETWTLAYRKRLLNAQLLPESVGEQQFLRWFDLQGLQRHIKVLGTFARLYLRDEKPAYLDDLPLVLKYVREMLEKYAGEEPAIAAFRNWFAQEAEPVIAAQEWSRPA